MRNIIGVAVAFTKLIRRVLFGFLGAFGYVLPRLRVILHGDIGAVGIDGVLSYCLFIAVCSITSIFSVIV